MRRTLPFALGAAAFIVACTTQSPQPPRPATQADVDAHVAKATSIAGDDLKGTTR